MVQDAWIIARKEIKLLFKSTRRIMLLVMTPAIILLVVLVSLFFAFVSAPPVGGPLEVIVIQDDDGFNGNNYGDIFYRMLKTQNDTKDLIYVNKSVDEFDILRNSDNLTLLLYFPSNFSEMVTRSNVTIYPTPALFYVYYQFDNGAAVKAVTNISLVATQLNLLLVYNEHGPVKITRLTAVHEVRVGEELPSVVTGYLTMIPLYAIFLLVLPSLTLVLISVTIEREQKTLESLLLQPLERRNIIAGKMLYGMMLVAFNFVSLAITTIVIIATVILMLPSEMRDQVNEVIAFILEAADANLWLFVGYVIVGLMLISVLLVAAAVLFSMLAKDEREANMVVSSFIILPMVGVMFLGFIPLDKLPDFLQIILLLLPLLGYMFGIYMAILTSQMTIVTWLSLAFQLVWIGITIWFAGRVIENEGILEISVRKLLFSWRRRH